MGNCPCQPGSDDIRAKRAEDAFEPSTTNSRKHSSNQPSTANHQPFDFTSTLHEQQYTINSVDHFIQVLGVLRVRNSERHRTSKPLERLEFAKSIHSLQSVIRAGPQTCKFHHVLLVIVVTRRVGGGLFQMRDTLAGHRSILLQLCDHVRTLTARNHPPSPSTQPSFNP